MGCTGKMDESEKGDGNDGEPDARQKLELEKITLLLITVFSTYICVQASVRCVHLHQPVHPPHHGEQPGLHHDHHQAGSQGQCEEAGGGQGEEHGQEEDGEGQEQEEERYPDVHPCGVCPLLAASQHHQPRGGFQFQHPLLEVKKNKI